MESGARYPAPRQPGLELALISQVLSRVPFQIQPTSTFRALLIFINRKLKTEIGLR